MCKRHYPEIVFVFSSMHANIRNRKERLKFYVREKKI